VIISTGLRQETNVATARDGSPWASREPTVVDPPGAQRPPSKSKYAEYAEYVGLRYAQYAEYISGRTPRTSRTGCAEHLHLGNWKLIPDPP
jgi:hypothetical protein